MRLDPFLYQRRSIRMPGYDYSQPGAYFVTLCTHGQECILGEVVDGQVRLSDAGQLVRDVWLGLPARFETVELDEFVVMPNHVHGIVVVVGAIHELPLPDTHGPATLNGIRSLHESPPRDAPDARVERRRMLLPRVVGYFKMNAAKRINELRSTPGQHVWQRNYYERVIRNERELRAIRQYILDNPLKWDLDRENPAVAAKGRR